MNPNTKKEGKKNLLEPKTPPVHPPIYKLNMNSAASKSSHPNVRPPKVHTPKPNDNGKDNVLNALVSLVLA